jgi:hypothetical protein
MRYENLAFCNWYSPGIFRSRVGYISSRDGIRTFTSFSRRQIVFMEHTSRDYDLVADSTQKARISIDGYAGTVEVLKYNLQGRAMLVLWRNGQLCNL